MKDIAAAVGVSVVTVSNALAGRKGVSDDVRFKVEKAAREMGYDVKKNDRQPQGTVIGVIAPEKYITVGNSFYWTLYQNVAYEASKAQCVTMLEIITFAMEDDEELPKLLKEKAISGLIIIGWMTRSYVEKIVNAAGIPVVLLDFQMKGLRCDAVMSSNYVGMYKITRYLLEKGHRDIAYVGSIQANDNIMDRYYGYRKALMEAGIHERKEWILEDRDLAKGLSRVEIPENMPSAFACNSDWAAGLLYKGAHLLAGFYQLSVIIQIGVGDEPAGVVGNIPLQNGSKGGGGEKLHRPVQQCAFFLGICADHLFQQLAAREQGVSGITDLGKQCLEG